MNGNSTHTCPSVEVHIADELSYSQCQSASSSKASVVNDKRTSAGTQSGIQAKGWLINSHYTYFKNDVLQGLQGIRLLCIQTTYYDIHIVTTDMLVRYWKSLKCTAAHQC